MRKEIRILRNTGCTPDRKVFDLNVEEQGLLPFGFLDLKVVKEGATESILQRTRIQVSSSLKEIMTIIIRSNVS